MKSRRMILSAGMCLLSLQILGDVTLANRRAKLVLNDKGRIVSLRSLDTGRELAKAPGEEVFALALLSSGKAIYPQSLSQDGDALIFRFAEGNLVVGVETKPDYFLFSARSHTLNNPKSLIFSRVARLACDTYCGSMSSMCSDEEDAVFLHGVDLLGDHVSRKGEIYIWTSEKYGLLGARAVLAVAAEKNIRSVLQGMTRELPVPRSSCGGAWSDGAEINRGSYLFADLTHESTDNWIDLTRRMGYADIHIHAWWKTLGSYEPNGHFPKGMEDMKDSVDRIHAAGLSAGIHTLSCGISPEDPWVRGSDNTNLVAWQTYTLDRDLGEKDTVVYVREKPGANHDTVFTYCGNGNALRIGTEIVQYNEVLREKPYGFRIQKRGAFQTQIAAHKAGGEVAYLQQRYWEFYPRHDSPLADRLAKRIGEIDRLLNLEEIYFDGAEGMMDRYAVDVMMRKIYAELNPNTQMEASGWYPHAWWFHSRIGAWDHAIWACKRFHDRHVLQVGRFRKEQLLAPQMGWWAPKMAGPHARGHFLEEMEYFACKNLAMDAASSIQGVDVSNAFLPFGIERQMTLLGQYERLRLARYFDGETLRRIGEPGKEFRLQRDAEDGWCFLPVRVTSRRLIGTGSSPLRCTLARVEKEQPAEVRVEALYAVEPYESSNRMVFVRAGDTFVPGPARSGVRVAQTRKTEDGRDVLVLTAENSTAMRANAFASLSHSFSPYADIGRAGAFGMWVKGDASGALLDVRILSPREYGWGQSDHILKLDFTGWRYFEFLLRERDTEEVEKHEWPFKGATQAIFRTEIVPSKISEVQLYLNDIPAQGKTTVAVSGIHALPLVTRVFEQSVITVNGVSVPVPCAFRSGDYLEMDGHSLRRYTAIGNLEAEFPLSTLVKTVPLFKGEKTDIELSAKPVSGVNMRAEITAFDRGDPFGGKNVSVDRKALSCWYEMPVMLLAPAPDGIPFSVFVRNGETAHLNVDVLGPVKGLKIRQGTQIISFPNVKSNTRLSLREGKDWTLRSAAGAVLSRGSLNGPLASLGEGKHSLTFFCTSCMEKGVRGRFSWFTTSKGGKE